MNMVKNLLFYFKKAQREKWAIGQFNFSTLEQLKAIFQAAKELGSPIILGTSEGESRFLGLEEAVALKNVMSKKMNIPAFLNLDHGKDLDYIKKAISAGYDYVQFDGSALDFNENLQLTKDIARYAHRKKVLLEGELGPIPGKSEIHQEKTEIKETDFTDPEQALKFIQETGVDSLAINVGTLHGIEASGRNPKINLLRLKEIKEKVEGKVFLVLHGGSGTPEEDIKEAIKLGVVKININTELRIAFCQKLKDSLNYNPAEIKPYKIFPLVIEEVKMVVENKIKIFNSINKI